MLRQRGDEYSVMNRAAQMPSGMATATATSATSTVPTTRPSTPMRTGVVSVRHSLVVKKRPPMSRKASSLRSSRNRPTSVSSTRTERPAPVVVTAKRRSARAGMSSTGRGWRSSGTGVPPSSRARTDDVTMLVRIKATGSGADNTRRMNGSPTPDPVR
jgi:hypothetical protein